MVCNAGVRRLCVLVCSGFPSSHAICCYRWHCWLNRNRIHGIPSASIHCDVLGNNDDDDAYQYTQRATGSATIKSMNSNLIQMVLNGADPSSSAVFDVCYATPNSNPIYSSATLGRQWYHLTVSYIGSSKASFIWISSSANVLAQNFYVSVGSCTGANTPTYIQLGWNQQNSIGLKDFAITSDAYSVNQILHLAL